MKKLPKTIPIEVPKGTATTDIRQAIHAALDALLDASELQEGSSESFVAEIGLNTGKTSIVFTAKNGEISFENEEVISQANEIFTGEVPANPMDELICCLLVDRMSSGKPLTLSDVVQSTGYAATSILGAIIQVRMRCDALGTLEVIGDKQQGWTMKVVEATESSGRADDFVLPKTYAGRGKTHPELRFSKAVGEHIQAWHQLSVFMFLDTRSEVAVAAALLEQLHAHDMPKHTLVSLTQRVGISTQYTVKKAVKNIEYAAGRNTKLGVQLHRGSTKVNNVDAETVWLSSVAT